MKHSLVACACVLFAASSLFGQAPSKQQESASQTPLVRTTTQEVELDMVFRDKKGRTIHDIRPEEVHVFENGAEQHLTRFGYVQEPSAEGAAPAAAQPVLGALPVDPLRELRLVTLVFQNLDLDGKRFFRQALQDVVKMAPEQNLYFSVVVIDQKLNMIQPFTNDRAALMKTVEKSMMWNTSQFMGASAEIKAELRRTVSGGESDSQSAASGDTAGPPAMAGGGQGGPGAGAVQGGVNWRMAKLQYDMLEQADAADRDAGARGTIDGLLALVRAESQLPGRKVVLYFNPWLYIPETLKEQYNYMVGAANRANVSFYTVDPKGLVTWSQEGSGRALLGGATGEIYRQQITGGVGEVTQSQAQVDEIAEAGIRSNPLLWLRDLAQQTGGMSIGETNDLKAPLRTVMDEVKSYYEAAYTPQIATYDGKFRRIGVRVDRPGIEVHTRSGYYALPRLNTGQQVLAYEVPLLNAISAATPAGEVPFSIGTERFDRRGPKVEYMVTLEIPMAGMTFAPQPDKKTALLDVPLLVLARGASGEIVGKFSKEFAVAIPAESVEARKQANLIQTFRTELPPGAYSIEAAVMDRQGGKVGVKKIPLSVPAPSGKLAISDVVIVRRTEILKDSPVTDPFYFTGGKVVPTLSTTLQGGPWNVLPFYFAVYPDAAIKDAPKLTMAFYKSGQYLGSAAAPLPAVQPDGRIPYIADLPADKFTPGNYEIRVDVTQGAAATEQKIDFQVK